VINSTFNKTPMVVYERTDMVVHTEPFAERGIIVIFDEKNFPLAAFTLAKAEEIAASMTRQCEAMRE
jgi:hypothetical protein